MLTRRMAFHTERTATIHCKLAHSDPSQSLHGHLILILLFALAIVLQAVL